MPQIVNGQGLDVSVPQGQSIAIATVTGTYSATVISGTSAGTVLATASDAGGTFGPYLSGATVRLSAGLNSCVSYEVGAAPVVGDAPTAKYSLDPTTGAVTGLVDPNGGSFSLAQSPVLFVNDETKAAQNTALIQAALDTAGTVLLRAYGEVFINDTLMIGSATSLYCSPSLTIKQANGINKTLIKSKGVARAFSSCTLAWSGGNTAVVTLVGNTVTLGEYVWLRGVPGTSQSQYSGVFQVIAKSGDDLTIRLRRRPTAAPSGAYEVKLADRSVAIYSLNLDYNVTVNNAATGTDTLAAVFGGVADIKISGLNVKNTKKYCVCFGAVTGFALDGLYSPAAASDGLKIYGPAFDGSVKNIRGRFNDDACSIQPQEASGYSQYDYTNGGDCINITIENIDATSDNAALFVLYSSQNQYADDIVIDHVSGNSASQKVKMYTGVGYTNCQVGRVTLRNVQWQENANSQSIIFDGSQTYNELIIDGFLAISTLGVTGLTNGPIKFSTGFVDKLTVTGARAYLSSQVPLIEIAGTTGISGVCVEKSNVSANSIGEMMRLSGTGTVRSVSFRDIKAGPLSKFVAVGSSMTSVPNIQIEGGDINAAIVVEAAAACTVNLRGGSRFTASTGVVRGLGAGTAVNIRSSGNTLASGNWISQGATAAFSVYSDDITADVTILARTPGAMVYNTNAVAGTLGAAGRVLCDSSGAANSWKLMTDPTKAF